MADRSNVSSDLIWEIARSQNSYLVKRRSGGGVQFSRDPFNLTNKHSRKHSGFVNDKAVSLQDSGNGGVTMITKKSKKNQNRPAASTTSVDFGKKSGTRKIYKAVANHTAKSSYRGDLRQDAIARASALKQAQQSKKDLPEAKPRGAKAKKVEA